ncbi:MAG: hypothetical protein J6R47_01135 [Acholeplasmatales bacterium]|nr:hypothetical protein [Acholeplasmatales bacterium]
MRLWHQKLIPYLDNQRLLGQHRECCALRGNGWGKKHSVVDYVFIHNPTYLACYHSLVMDEMFRRGYLPDTTWYIPNYRGKNVGIDKSWSSNYNFSKYDGMLYPEHNNDYLTECIELLKKKEAPIDWSKVNV